MCDYSLEAYRSRPARVGEQYVTHYFPNHGVGFISARDPDTVVFMACGMTLRLENLPEYIQTSLGVKPDETVTFIRHEGGWFRDGVRFSNGDEITLQRLGGGVKGSLIHEARPVQIERERVLVDY